MKKTNEDGSITINLSVEDLLSRKELSDQMIKLMEDHIISLSEDIKMDYSDLNFDDFFDKLCSCRQRIDLIVYLSSSIFMFRKLLGILEK